MEWLRLQYTLLREECEQALNAQQAILQWSLAALAAIVAGGLVLMGGDHGHSPQQGEIGSVLLLVFGLGIPGISLCAYLVWWGELFRMERTGQFLRGVEVEVARAFPDDIPPLQWEHFVGSRLPPVGAAEPGWRRLTVAARKQQIGYVGAAGIYAGFATASLFVFGTLVQQHRFRLGSPPWPSIEAGLSYAWIAAYSLGFIWMTVSLRRRANTGATRGYRLLPALPTEVDWISAPGGQDHL